jgi:hypothetical protein
MAPLVLKGQQAFSWTCAHRAIGSWLVGSEGAMPIEMQ